MKKTMTLFLVVAMCLMLVACGAKKNNNKAEGDGWKVTADGVLVISNMEDNEIPERLNGNPEAPWHPYRMMIKSVKVEEGITHIGEYGFISCEKAETIELPDSLLQIGDHAFAHCVSLKELTIPENVNFVGYEAFLCCEALEHVVWSPAAMTVGKRTFSGCSALKTVDLPEGVLHIDELAFENCSMLTSLTLPDSLRTFEKDSFQGCTNLVLECSAGTAAEEMAVKHKVPYK